MEFPTGDSGTRVFFFLVWSKGRAPVRIGQTNPVAVDMVTFNAIGEKYRPDLKTMASKPAAGAT